MRPNQEQRRKQAIDSYLKGEKVQDICQRLSCSTSFLYRWLDRFNLAHPNDRWEKERSRRPLTNPTKTPETLAKHIGRLYDERTENGQHPTANAIRHALIQQGIAPLPAIRTIYRILSHHKRAPPEQTRTP